MERRPQKVPFFRDDETEGSSIIVASLPYLFILGDDKLVKDAVLNRVIGLNTHLDDTHIDMDRLKFVLFRIYNHVQMCRKQN